jgi:hypothetical protein
MPRLLLVVVVWSLAACDLGRSKPDDGLVLRTYEVPSGSVQRLRAALMEVFKLGADKDAPKYAGRADVTPDGRLIVLAPEQVQDGVKGFVDSVMKNPPKGPEAVTLTYWVLTGVAGAEQKEALPTELDAALAEVRKADGPQAFSLVEKLSLSSTSGEFARIMGRDTSVDQTATATATDVTADVRLERPGQRLSTRVRLAPGKLVVLAASGAPLKDAKDPNETPKTVLFIVKATPSGGDGR